MEFAAFVSQLKKSKPLPVYGVYGEEEFLVEQAVGLVKEKVLEGEDPHACCVERDAAEGLSPAAVFDELRTLPFFSKRRVVLVRNAQAFIKDHSESILRYLESPSRTGILVLIADSIDSRTRVAKTIESAGALVACKGMREKDAAGWIVAQTTERGKRIAPRACRILLENAGTDLFQLAMHIEKLSIYVGDRQEIAEADVEALVGPDRERASYELGSAVRKKQPAAALKILRDILAGDEDAKFWLVAVLSREIRTLWSVKRLMARGAPDAEIIAAAPFARTWLSAYMQEVRPFAPDELRRKYRLLLDADLRNKTGAMDAALALECLVVELCR
ncbi:MAG: DNA polymerase III subunit delta [Planctomycetota bacterium]